jgi:hypothetical protein
VLCLGALMGGTGLPVFENVFFLLFVTLVVSCVWFVRALACVLLLFCYVYCVVSSVSFEV